MLIRTNQPEWFDAVDPTGEYEKEGDPRKAREYAVDKRPLPY
jgi:hypothetical protein